MIAAFDDRDWRRGGAHIVHVRMGVQGCKHPGNSWSKLSESAAWADAVVDDFGNLVIVGRWS